MEFVETICVEEGKAWNLPLHNNRLNETRRVFWGENIPTLKLEDWVCPENYAVRTRCRVLYAKEVLKVEYFPYHMRKVDSLKMVVCDDADYTFKSADRSLLNSLYEQRGEADDVLIVRHGLLTDTSIANIALYDGEHWYTPAQPLLKGTRRQSLLNEGKIYERDIKAADVGCYQKISLFNAMIPFRAIEFDAHFIIE